MSKKNETETIRMFQEDSNYIVLKNPLSSPKFVRMIGKGENKEVIVSDTYTPKIFYEIVSRLTPEDLHGINENQSIKLDININQFLNEIGANSKNYKHLINSIEALQTMLFKWKEDGLEHKSAIINYSIHDPKSGKVQVQIHEKMVKHILEVKQKDNFSFLKSNVFKLQNAQSIRLYPFFKSWVNHGKYVTDLERFKCDFGYDTSGYRFYTNLEKKVLMPAIGEINEKTDILVSYELTGENLDSQRPRVKGLIFTIKSKEPQLKVIEPVTIIEAMPESRQNELSTLYTIFTGLKFDPFARLSRETAEATIRQWVDKNGYDAVYNGLIRAKETYTGEIKNPIGFFSNSYFKENKDYLKQKGQSTNEQLKKNQDKQTAELIKSIQESYRKRRDELLEEMYNQASDEQKRLAFEIIKDAPKNIMNGRNIALDQKGKLNTFGVLQAGSMFAEAQGKGVGYRQPKYINHILEKHNIQIRFDHNDEVVYLNNVE